MTAAGISDSRRQQKARDKGGSGMRATRIVAAGDGRLQQGASREGNMVVEGRKEVGRSNG